MARGSKTVRPGSSVSGLLSKITKPARRAGGALGTYLTKGLYIGRGNRRGGAKRVRPGK